MRPRAHLVIATGFFLIVSQTGKQLKSFRKVGRVMVVLAVIKVISWRRRRGASQDADMHKDVTTTTVGHCQNRYLERLPSRYS